MPFKSKKQRRKFWAMAEQGEISENKVREWERKTTNKNLPERVTKKESMVHEQRTYQAGARAALEKLRMNKL